MTTLAHLDPNFGSVFAIEAVNGMHVLMHNSYVLKYSYPQSPS